MSVINTDISTERIVIGSLLIEPKSSVEVFRHIKQPEVFHDDTNRKVFTVIQNLYNDNQAIDLATVTDASRKAKIKDADLLLIDYTTTVSSTAHIESWCLILLQHYVKRYIVRVAADLNRAALDEGEDALEMMEKAYSALDMLNHQLVGSNHVEWKEVLENTVKDIERLSNKDIQVGASIGIARLDGFMHGFLPGELIILAARPGMGKTAFAGLVSQANLKRGDAVAFFSLEMNDMQVAKRFIALETSQLHANQLYKHGIQLDKDWKELFRVVTQAEDYSLHLLCRPGLTVFECMTEARILKKKHNIQLLVVDYLQLMGGTNKGRNHNREQEISEVSRNLKKLSLELQIPVVALSQLSREVEKRGNKRPVLSDLRESGSIEQDADMVIFLYRPEYYGIETLDDGSPSDGVCEVIISKYRNGSLGTIPVGFDANHVRFHDLEENINIPEEFLATDNDNNIF